MKRILSVLLSVALVLSMIPAAFAAGSDFRSAADHLYQLGLVSGTGTDADGNPIYELDRAPTRSEAITVLVKLLGKAEEAGRGGWRTPFVDVPGWAQNFVGYAYANGLTAGTSSTTFGGSDLVTASQYITFVLKALGYSANSDFQWDRAWELSDRLGITGGRYNAGTAYFTRGDVFAISEAALKVNIKGTDQTLAEKLMAAGVFTRAQYEQIYADVPQPGNQPSGPLIPREISEKCASAVFYLESYTINGDLMGSGSGFFISSDGTAITNRHVVEHAYYFKVRTPDGRTFTDVRVMDGNFENDLALLWVVGENFPYLELGDSDTLKQGQQVYAFGCPIGLENTMSQGIISNPSRTVDGTEYVQISVPIDHGSSGGALVDEYGAVVGVTAGGFESSADLNLAVPINAADSLNIDRETDLFLLNAGEGFYNGFEYVYDFGKLSGVDLVGYIELPLGWFMSYDLTDFYAINGKTAYDSYEDTMEFYGKILEKYGMEQIADEDGLFYSSDTEWVYIMPDADDERIYIRVEWYPVDYAKHSGVLDFGWLVGGEPVDTYLENDGSTSYIYDWDDFFSKDRAKELLELYMEHLVEEETFELVSDGYVEDGYGWLLENRHYIVLIVLDNDGYIYINVE